MKIIRNLLSSDETNQILSKEVDWKEGHTKASKVHKNNFEALDEDIGKYIAQKIQGELADEVLMKRLTLPRLNKYEVGGKYRTHIDAFSQHGVRTDYSYTLMLKAPEAGGQLVIIEDGRVQKPKLNAGDLVVYRSGLEHCVQEVRKGERIAAIGWIESVIRESDKRDILRETVKLLKALDKEGFEDKSLQVSYIYHNLLRLWSE